MKKPNVLLFTSLAMMMTSLPFISTNHAVAGDSIRRITHAIKQRERQTQTIQRQLTKSYGDDAWYVFQVAGIKQNMRQSVVRVTNGVRYRNFATFTVTSQMETKTFKVHGSAVAADMIWQGNHSPVRFVYRVFTHEQDADAFHSSIK